MFLMVVAMSTASFAEEVQNPGQTTIDPGRFAAALNIQLEELARLARVHRAIVAEVPANTRLQNYLREATRVIAMGHQIVGNRDRALYWFRNVPIPEFGYQTAEELVSHGKSEAALSYLTSVETGSSG
jgi:hypothetical protein